MEKKSLTPNWKYTTVGMQNLSETIPMADFFNINIHKSAFSFAPNKKDSVNALPFIMVGLPFVLEKSISVNKNKDLKDFYNSLLKTRYFKDKEELLGFMQELNSLSCIEFRKDICYYIMEQIHQSNIDVNPTIYNNILALEVLQFCSDNNSFVRLFSDFLNKVWVDLPTLLVKFSKDLQKNHNLFEEYTIPDTQNTIPLLLDEKVCMVITMQFLLQLVTYADKGLITNDTESVLREKLKTTCKPITDSFSTLFGIENTMNNVILEYLNGKTILPKRNYDSAIYKKFGVFSCVETPSFIAIKNNMVEKEVYDEMMYSRKLYGNSDNRQSRLFSRMKISTTVYNFDSSMTMLLNDRKEKKQTKNKDEIKELKYKLDKANQKIKDLEKEVTLVRVECSDIVANKDFELSNKAELLKQQSEEIKQLKIISAAKETQVQQLLQWQDTPSDLEENITYNGGISLEEKIAYLNKYKIILLGGMFETLGKCNDLGWTNLSQHDNCSDTFGNVDYACLMTKFCSHALRDYYVAQNSTNKEKLFYFNNVSVNLLIDCCYEYIFNTEQEKMLEF